MTTLPLPPQPPRDLPPELQSYINEVYAWQLEVTRVVQDQVLKVLREYQNKNDPVEVPPATVAELTSTNPKFKPGTPSNGGTRLAYATDATGGAVLVFSDGSDWRDVDGRAIVS
jgi:hypothetical protein